LQLTERPSCYDNIQLKTDDVVNCLVLSVYVSTKRSLPVVTVYGNSDRDILPICACVRTGGGVKTLSQTYLKVWVHWELTCFHCMLCCLSSPSGS